MKLIQNLPYVFISLFLFYIFYIKNYFAEYKQIDPKDINGKFDLFIFTLTFILIPISIIFNYILFRKKILIPIMQTILLIILTTFFFADIVWLLD